MTFSEKCNRIFWNVCLDYHKHNDVDACMQNPYKTSTIEYSLYKKCWIDAILWHLEDIICNPKIESITALYIKRRIDKSNQDRTKLAEIIDCYFLDKYKDVKVTSNLNIVAESLAKIIDSLSFSSLKIYHTQQKVERIDTTPEQKEKYQAKLDVLLRQRIDLSAELDKLLKAIEPGEKRI